MNTATDATTQSPVGGARKAGRIAMGIGAVYARVVRPLLPTRGHIRFSGVAVARRAMFDEKLPKSWTFAQDKPSYKAGYIRSHRDHTRAGDCVAIVGGGFGVSAVIASQYVGPQGRVTIYEGSRAACKEVERVLDINGAPRNWAVVAAIVGPAIDLGGESAGDIRSIDPGTLPECDVLELDCEGAEFDILRAIKIRPRVIFCEIHPWKVDRPADEPLDTLLAAGYELAHCRDNHGNEYGVKAFRDYLETISKSPSNRPRPVVTAIRRDAVVR